VHRAKATVLIRQDGKLREHSSSGLHKVFNTYPIARAENSPGEFLTMTPPRRSKSHPFRAAQTKNSHEFRLLAKNIDFCHDREYRARTVD